MTRIDNISLENEMDIVVAQQHTMRAARSLLLTLSTQTTISTAVAEISRVVIDRTDTGTLMIGIDRKDAKYFFTAVVTYDSDTDISSTDEKLRYARLLVPEFKLEKKKSFQTITVSIGIPRNSRITEALIASTVNSFREAVPATPYEKLKVRNTLLMEQTTEQEMLLKHTRLLDEKKNDFISMASHELKTPLTTLIAFTQMGLMEAQKTSAGAVLPYLEKINTQAYKLNALIQQLLNISKIEAGRMDIDKKVLNWNVFLDDLLPLLRLLVPQHLLTASPCAMEVLLRGDSLRLEQVMTNIVGNAAKYAPQHTEILISCAVTEGEMRIRVKDAGVGISDEHIVNVFDKYFREPEKIAAYSGLGMGLFISAGIIKAHGGKIWAENNPEGGCSFYFTLPLIEAVDA